MRSSLSFSPSSIFDTGMPVHFETTSATSSSVTLLRNSLFGVSVSPRKLCASRRASPKAIQELMRHSDLAMTQRYTHLSPAARGAAVRLLDEPVPPASRGDDVETGSFATPNRL